MRAQRLVAYGTMLTVTLTVTWANTDEQRRTQRNQPWISGSGFGYFSGSPSDPRVTALGKAIPEHAPSDPNGPRGTGEPGRLCPVAGGCRPNRPAGRGFVTCRWKARPRTPRRLRARPT